MIDPAFGKLTTQTGTFFITMTNGLKNETVICVFPLSYGIGKDEFFCKIFSMNSKRTVLSALQQIRQIVEKETQKIGNVCNTQNVRKP